MCLFRRGAYPVLRLCGPLKDAVEMVRTEIVDGGLLQDCLELGSNDLKGVIQTLKDLTSQYTTSNSSKIEEL
ncbi:hypothetical protein HanPI659440_Chr11g0430751 [Helianthus annuus]|nr:hypothetical protein HanPI659440_Chr11g0430751 [Helianthus annuus]